MSATRLAILLHRQDGLDAAELVVFGWFSITTSKVWLTPAIASPGVIRDKEACFDSRPLAAKLIGLLFFC
jgi:hypothetical protein